MPSLLAKMKVLLILEKNSGEIEIKLFPVVRYFTWNLTLISNILWVITSLKKKGSLEEIFHISYNHS